MPYSIIQKLQLEGAMRLDAEYYQPEYFIDFTKGNWQSIGNFLELCQYGISQAMNQENVGYPIFRMDDIKDAFLTDSNLKYADITKNIFEQYRLQVDDILFNRVNSEEFVGRTGIFKLIGDYVFASYLIRLRVKKDSSILNDYLNIFLNSSYGIKQIKKYRRRAVNQANVNAEELKQIKIPILPLEFQQRISDIINQSWSETEFSKTYYKQAEQLLLQELSFANFTEEESLSYITSLSDVKETERMDAEYFLPKYEKLINKIKEHNSQKFADVIENVPANLNPTLQPDKKFHYVELANINSSIGIIDGFSEVLGIEAPSRAKRTLKEGDIIVSSIEGSLEKVALVGKEQEGYIASTGFFQLRSKNIQPEVILVMAKSIILQMQLQKRTAGTILSAVPKETLNDLLIPILPLETQQEIADLVKQSHEARKKSKELLEQAKREVEAMIEKG